ncbi:MAG: hypothetical protein FJY76_03405 [Candidatus Aenigmarchaeota archaeon]|nr:hypothetical protein [Candidatus Aenigmarchaeota archaeon]
MPPFIFVHGKNFELSLAELVSLAGRRPEEASPEFSVFDLLEAKDMMGRLGGTLKIAQVVSMLDTDAGQDVVGRAIEKHFHEFMKGVAGNRLVFGVSFYGGEGDRTFVEQKIKELGKAEGMKVSAAHAKGSSNIITHTQVLEKRILRSGFEVLLCMGRKHLYVAKTIAVHDPFEFRKRDLKRPIQRPIYSIPPRLARIMLNLSGAKRGDVVMDPFCGIGTILGEASLMGMRVIGIDTKDSCIGDTRKNLRWLEKEYKIKIPDMENIIRKEDARWLSSHFKEDSIDAIATEPYMGPPLKRRPDRVRAMQILDSLKQLYEHSLREMLTCLKPGRRICMVSPAFIVKNKFYGLPIAEMAGRHGGRVVNVLGNSGINARPPLRDFEERHNTIREIHVIEKVAH